MRSPVILSGWLLCAVAAGALWAQDSGANGVPATPTAARGAAPLWFNTFFVTWGGTTDPKFTEYLNACKPEIVQVGFYGPLFHGYADNPKSTGYPMQLPVAGQREALAVQRQVNVQIHQRGLKAIGHFQMVNVIADWEKRDGFIDFYENHWPQDLLGPRPHEDVRELLQRDAEGNVIVRKHYVPYVGLCTSSPYARAALKAMLKVAIDAGVDGIMSNYNYHWGCVCPYCQASFKEYLGRRYDSGQLREKLGIENLADHRFTRIAAEIPGYPAADAAPIDYEAMRWGAIAFKEAFDEVLIDYGRSLRPDLIVATWNHLGRLGPSEERAFLPIDLWGKGEDYFWYSGAHQGTDLARGEAGDGWLLALYIRELSGGKPFMLGKYEQVRMRNSIAEGVATGGAGMGLYMNFRDPAGFSHGVRYTNWLHLHRKIYENASPLAEVALLLPRQSMQAGMRGSLDAFRTVGQALVRRQVLVEVVADQKLTAQRLSPYAAVIVPQAACLNDEQVTWLRDYARSGGYLFVMPPAATHDQTPAAPAGGATTRPGAGLDDLPPSSVHILDAAAADDDITAALYAAAGSRLSRIAAPWTVRAGAFERPGGILLHLVNYNRDENVPRELKNKPAGEQPIAAQGIEIDLRLPHEAEVSRVILRSPDADAGDQALTFEQSGRRLRLTIPEVLVYGVVEIKW